MFSNYYKSYLMALHIYDIRAIRSNVSLVIPSADFITNTPWMDDTNFNRLFSGKPK